ncbi:LLM class flavin-dependent oxidoreductase [Kaistia algarum]|uniref:LLM class flavin-dependent oxidoreductase n=1 Tax=Kaistia algarum TaxID=2083279 RepID=UPI000CE79667|nr:LLM class flavin-dependent oxidoreductase [Kaistia algarum]MCX5513960.1 LLM class flavin-dependent oxidoreductase [Kaistia algarum]PPE78067.1 LLM class flavin-dependent oxidoreductase [Kaistia algarum]
MEFGLFNLMTYRGNPGGLSGVVADTRSLVKLAEDIGFGTAWFAEHHFTNYSISVSPLMLAAYMAGETSRIKVGAAVVVLPLYHPMRVAQEIALLDQLSEGRAMLGVGTGYQPYEFARYHVSVEEKTEIFLEYWAIVEQILTDGRACFAGKYIQVPESVFLLKPRRSILSELFLTTNDPRILSALGHLDPVPFITTGWRGTPALMTGADKMLKHWEAVLGRKPRPIAVQQYIHVTDDPKDALIAAEHALSVGRLATHLNSPAPKLDGSMLDPPPLPDEPPLETVRDFIIAGDPHHVAERIVAEIRAFDPHHYSTFFQFGDLPIAMARRSLERFGAEVIPLIEREVGPLDRIGRREAPAPDIRFALNAATA